MQFFGQVRGCRIQSLGSVIGDMRHERATTSFGVLTAVATFLGDLFTVLVLRLTQPVC